MWAITYRRRKNKTVSPVFAWTLRALFSLVTLAFPLSQAVQMERTFPFPTRADGCELCLPPRACVWREGPIISAVWEFKRHAYSNLLFHSPGPLSSPSSFPVSYSSYPSTGKPPPRCRFRSWAWSRTTFFLNNVFLCWSFKQPDIWVLFKPILSRYASATMPSRSVCRKTIRELGFHNSKLKYALQ